MKEAVIFEIWVAASGKWLVTR